MFKEEDFDIGISYAIEDIDIVQKVINELKQLNISILWDKDNEDILVGRSLPYSLKYFFENNLCKYYLIFVSTSYVRKPWTRYESEILLEKRIKNLQKDFMTDKIILVNIDGAQLEGWSTAIVSFDINKQTPKQIASIMQKKLNRNIYNKETSSCLENVYFDLIKDISIKQKGSNTILHKIENKTNYQTTVQLTHGSVSYFLHILLEQNTKQKILKIYEDYQLFRKTPNAWDAEVYLHKSQLFYINYNFSEEMPAIPHLFTYTRLLKLMLNKLDTFIKEHQYV